MRSHHGSIAKQPEKRGIVGLTADHPLVDKGGDFPGRETNRFLKRASQARRGGPGSARPGPGGQTPRPPSYPMPSAAGKVSGRRAQDHWRAWGVQLSSMDPP